MTLMMMIIMWHECKTGQFVRKEVGAWRKLKCATHRHTHSHTHTQENIMKSNTVWKSGELGSCHGNIMEGVNLLTCSINTSQIYGIIVMIPIHIMKAC
jgi:hypothetical protein